MRQDRPDSEARDVQVADALGRLKQSPDGQVLIDAILEMVDTGFKRAIDAKSEIEMARIMGGVRFGKDILTLIDAKISIGQQVRRAAEERRKRHEENQQSMNRIRRVGSKYAHDAG